jgi:hypothetical protein
MSPRRYTLAYRPLRPVIRRASAYNFPLSTPSDYAAITELVAQDEHAPVLLDHAQYFEFLARLVSDLRAALGAHTRIFIELRMPSVGRLPDGLLRAGIVMGANLRREAAFWAAHGAEPVVWLGDRIRRELDHAADNTLTVAVWPETASAAADAVIARSWPEHAIAILPFQTTRPT